MTASLFEEPVEAAPPVILRHYQEGALRAFRAAQDRGIHRSLIVMATGTGKTSLFSSLIREEAEDPSWTGLVIAHQKELLTQAADRIRRICPGLRVELESGEAKASPGASVVVGSVQSLGGPGCEKLDWLAPSLIICDEAHHAAAPTYQRVFSRFGCYGTDPHCDLLGVTATPHRLDNKALHGHDRAIFEEVVFQYGVLDGIRDGYLSDLKGFRAVSGVDLSKVKTKGGDYDASQLEEKVNTDSRNELAFQSWKEAADGQRTVVFCAGVSHAQAVAKLFTENGVKAEAIYGDLPKHVRDQVMERFRRGETQVLTNMALLTEGVDVPEISCVLMLRPTKSWALYVQMVGRGLRVLPGVVDGIDEATARRAAVARSKKPHAVVIDIIDNAQAHSLTQDPKEGGLPSLNDLVGMPSALDLEGKTLGEAADLWEGLPEDVKASAFRKVTSLSGLSAKLTAIDLLGELDVPEEAVRANARLQWQKLPGLKYLINCGYNAGETQRSAYLEGDMLGKWKLRLVSNHRNETHDLPNSIEPPFVLAERVIQSEFMGVLRMADRMAGWRQGAVTEAQIRALKSLNVEDEVIGRLQHRGQASQLMDRMLQLRKEGRS